MTAGRFSEGLASWRRVIASVPDIDNRLTIFDNAAADIGNDVANGLDKLTAVDELQEMASAYGLVDAAGDDEIQSIIAAAIARGEQQAEIVPDELEQPKTDWRHAAQACRVGTRLGHRATSDLVAVVSATCAASCRSSQVIPELVSHRWPPTLLRALAPPAAHGPTADKHRTAPVSCCPPRMHRMTPSARASKSQVPTSTA